VSTGRTVFRLVPDDALEGDCGAGFTRSQAVGVRHDADVTGVYTGVSHVHGRAGTDGLVGC